METYYATKKLRILHVRTLKESASFLYFQLEANEGLAFYSTIESGQGLNFREISITSPVELSSELDNLLEHFSKQHQLEIIQESIIIDSP
jgi:hypothetical protein